MESCSATYLSSVKAARERYDQAIRAASGDGESIKVVTKKYQADLRLASDTYQRGRQVLEDAYRVALRVASQAHTDALNAALHG